MLWSDNDVTNDFTVAVEGDGSQEHDPEYLRVAVWVYQLYQKQLRMPGCIDSAEPPVARTDQRVVQRCSLDRC